MDKATKEDIQKLTAALSNQKTIKQLSTSGKAAKTKREELRKAREAREAAESKETNDGKSG
jgi:hypothetical protein